VKYVVPVHLGTIAQSATLFARFAPKDNHADPNPAGSPVVGRTRVPAVVDEESIVPYAPLKPCSHQGCGELVAKGMCEKHKKETAAGYDRYRGSRQSRGYDSTWEKLRLQALKRDGYICQECLKEGRMVPASDVDHVVRFTSNTDPLRLDLSNLRSLCRPCHARKTVLVDGGFGKTKRDI
jgi:5-methylcytosine-specific restriction enzyme A